MSDLLTKFLAHYDPVHRGLTRSGVAHGMVLTRGFSFPRIAGGYTLYRGGGGIESVDWDHPVGAASADANEIVTFPWVTHVAGTTYTYALRAIGGGGVEEQGFRNVHQVEFDSLGALVPPRPNSPTNLRLSLEAGGRFRIRWSYSEANEPVAPNVFHVFHDNATGTVDFNTMVAVVAFRPRQFHYAYLSDAFAHDTRLMWSVRAVSALEVDEGNTVAVTGVADAQGPPIHPTVRVERGFETHESDTTTKIVGA